MQSIPPEADEEIDLSRHGSKLPRAKVLVLHLKLKGGGGIWAGQSNCGELVYDFEKVLKKQGIQQTFC